ncbi:MAG: alpha/beta hydrolase [Pseudomonadales bacterium]|nr:alpha/beta hydrolase [Pseudomonadales bacterium]
MLLKNPNGWKGPIWLRLTILIGSVNLLTFCQPLPLFWASSLDGGHGDYLTIPMELTKGVSAEFHWNVGLLDSSYNAEAIEISPSPVTDVIDFSAGSLTFIPQTSAYYEAVFKDNDGAIVHRSSLGIAVLHESCTGTDLAGEPYAIYLELWLPDSTKFPEANYPVVLTLDTYSHAVEHYFLSNATEQGYVAASINYGRSAEARMSWPTPLQDAKCVVRWLRANATELKIDPNAIAAVGVDSVGGLVATMLGVTDVSTDNEKQDLINEFNNVGQPTFIDNNGQPPVINEDIDDRVQAVVTISGLNHPETGYFEYITRWGEESAKSWYTWFLGEVPVEGEINEIYDQASPIYYMDADSANKPYLIINSDLRPKQNCMLRSAIVDSGGSDVTMIQETSSFDLFDDQSDMSSLYQFLDYNLKGGAEPNYTQQIYDDANCDLVL